MSWQDEFVEVRNPTEQTLEWDGRKYPPHGRATVPFLNMINSYGDPRSQPGSHQVFRASNGEQGIIQTREAERSRVQVVWGQYTKWDDIPRLEFYTIEGGERLFTVVDDPSGDHAAPANPTVEQQSALQKTVERQQEIINRLLEVAGLDKDALPQTYTPTDAIPADVHPGDLADIPVDDSTAGDTQSPWAHSTDDVTLDE